MMKQRQKLKPSKQSDSDDEETELFTVSRPSRATVEKLVEEGDTLQSLAIRYHCTIEDLKRLNNIHKENEIFAKRAIRVPHHPLSMALAGVHLSGRSSPSPSHTTIDTEKFSSAIDTEILGKNLEETEVNRIIFNSNISQTNEESEQESDEEVRLLPQKAPEPHGGPKLHCSGVDGGISLKALLLFIVILIVAVPLIYVFYIAEHQPA